MTTTRETRFRIHYENPRRPVPEPDLFDGYDLESAFDDYLPSGARATIFIDSYTLEMTGAKFLELVESCLPLAEQFSGFYADDSKQIREAIPELTSDTKVYSWLFGHFVLWLPVIIFATDGDTVRIYTRTLAETDEHSIIFWSERDLPGPVCVPQIMVVDVILTFLARYLDDLVGTFPFLAEDELYQEYRNRIAFLSP